MLERKGGKGGKHEKLKLDESFFPDRDEINYRNPPEMNIVIQIIGSRGNTIQRGS